MNTVDPADSVNLLQDFETIYGADLVGSTVMRVRGSVGVAPSGATGPTGRVLAAAGIQVIDGSAFVGAPLQLGPLTADRYGEWFGYHAFVMPQSGVGKVPSWLEWAVDVRAKRKIDELRQMLLLGIESDTTASDVFYAFHLSMLIALP